MNLDKYFTSSKLQKVTETSPDIAKFLDEKNIIKERILQDYQNLFVHFYDSYDIEFAHYENDNIISQLADFYQDKLATYFQCKDNHHAAYNKIKRILINARVYIVTRYTRIKPVFNLTDFMVDNLPEYTLQLIKYIPSKSKKFLAVMDYFNSTNDVETLSQLNDFLQKGCRLV